MNLNTLFISDNSITNPILYSQGLPFLNNISRKGWNCYILTFEINNEEKYTSTTMLEYERYNSVEELDFIQVYITLSRIIPTTLKMLTKGLITSYKIIKSNNIQIIHARSFLPALIAVTLKVIFFRKKDLKVIYDTRGAFIDEWLFIKNRSENSMLAKFAKYVEKLLLQHSDKIIAVSEFYKNYIINTFSQSSNFDRKVNYIPNRTFIINEEPNSNFNISKNAGTEVIGVFSGSAAPWQGVENLFELIYVSYQNQLKMKFKIITYEPEKIKNQHKIVKDMLSSTLQIINLNSLETKKILKQCSFGILPRDKNFINLASSPLKFAEYLAAGLPVLAGEGIGDTEEIINKYNVGVIIKNKNYLEALNSMMALLEDEDIRNRCRSVAEKYFNIEKSFAQYEQIYNSLVQED